MSACVTTRSKTQLVFVAPGARFAMSQVPGTRLSVIAMSLSVMFPVFATATRKLSVSPTVLKSVRPSVGISVLVTVIAGVGAETA